MSSIHQEALQVLGREEALSRMQSELIELLHALKQYQEGKCGADRVIAEGRDCDFVWQRVCLIPQFEQAKWIGDEEHKNQAKAKLQAVIDKKGSDEAMQDFSGDGDA